MSLASKRLHTSWKKLYRRLPRRGRGHQPDQRRVSAFIAALLALVLVSVLTPGCGSAAKERNLAAFDRAQIAVSQAFVDWDVAHERDIVDQGRKAGKSNAELRAEIAAYRVKSDGIDHALGALSYASHLAKRAIADGKDSAGLLAQVLGFAAEVVRLARDVGFPVPQLEQLLGGAP